MSSQVEQRAAVAPLARQELARRHPADFLSTLVPSYQRTPHTEALCDVLERLEAREINRVIICMPPRHGKTLHVSQAFPAWCLGRHPDAQIILASYSAELAEQNSRRGRGFLLDPRWPFSGVAVSAESAAVNRWHTTRGGGVIAAGVRGGLTGFGADVLVVDDAVRDRAEADSEAARASAWEWFAQVALTRLQPNAAVLVMGTRWHEDDLIGRILASPSAGEWTLLSLPALAEENDPLGRLEGEALWPAWYPKERLEALRQEIGERAFLALYQQRPSSERGGVFRREWMSGRYAGLPARCTTVIQSADSAFKVGVANDYSVVSTWATDGRYFYLVDVWRRRVEFPELVAAIKAQAALHSPSSILIEDTAARSRRSRCCVATAPCRSSRCPRRARARSAEPRP